VFEPLGRREEAQQVILIDEHRLGGAGNANRLIEDVVDTAGVIRLAKIEETAHTPIMIMLLPWTMAVPASSPMAMLELPSMQPSSASSPTAVLKEPVVLLNMESSPNELFWLPVLFSSAL
jgi:hypothetical protein